MDFLKGISQAMAEAARRGASDDLGNLGLELVKMKNQVREAIQQLTAKDIEAVIEKLENQESLSPQEKDAIKLWLVGDAEGYVAMEEDFRDWQKEFSRLTGVMRDYETRDLSVRDLMNLQGVLEDAILVAHDLRNFLDKKERLARFEQAMAQLDRRDKEFIAGMLKDMQRSSEM
jgi:hypothetical protein